MRNLAAAALALFAALTPGAAFAAILTYTGVFSGAAEVPPVITPGSGSAIVTIDTAASTMRVRFEFMNLIADTTVSHIHCCAAPTAGVATSLPSFAGFPAEVNIGAYDRTFDLLDAASWNPAFVAANGGTLSGAIAALLDGLKNGLAYANIHTKDFPAGEIRANLTFIPIPGAAALFLAGLAALMARRRRFRP
jgi:hypothetical protein